MTDQQRDGQVVTFYSYKGGTGRTMSLANVAWILAANGKRVLVVDWDLESPGLDRYFAPFIDAELFGATRGVVDMILDYGWAATNTQEPGLVKRYAMARRYAFSLVGWDFPGDGAIDMMPAGQQNFEYGATAGPMASGQPAVAYPNASARLLAVNNWDDFYQHQDGGRFFDALRADMKREYDFTLIDSRTGHGDVAAICTSQLPDVLVDCFTYSDQGIDGAADIARQLTGQYARRNVRVLPVPMRVDPAEKRKADRGRASAMRSFADLPSAMDEEARGAYWSRVQVPYQAFYAYEETLATFGDDPGLNGSLLSAYENLTHYITGGEISALPPVDPTKRAEVNLKFERQPLFKDMLVVLVNAEVDPVWAEWIEYVLSAAGLRVARGDGDPNAAPRPLDPDAQPILLVARPNVEVERARGERALGGREPVAIYVADVAPVSWIPAARSAFVAHVSPAVAAQRIGESLRLPMPDIDGLLEQAPRFPDTEHGSFNVPPRNIRFTGREPGLRELRATLRSSASVVLAALQGMGGVGKSQLALEYAYRYRSAYDLVFWVNADTSEALELALRELGDTVGLDTEQTGPEFGRAVINEVSRTKRQWLLIFDNADDPHHLLPYIPPVSGHILITSRNPGWSETALMLYVDVFTREESVKHLRVRVPTMSERDADEVAEELADLPLVVSAAGAWLADSGTSAREYLRIIRADGPGVALTRSHDVSIARTWDLSLLRLREQHPAAYRLFQLCSVMAPEIALELVYSDKMAEYLVPLNPGVSDQMLRARMVQQINRLALLRLDHRTSPLRDNGGGGQMMIHRVVQAVVREHMTEDELRVAREQVHEVLAHARPTGEVDQQRDWPKYQILWPHADVSEAVYSSNDKVRQLLIDRVRYHYLLGEMVVGRERAEEIDKIWSAELERLGESQARTDLKRQLLQLRFNLANVVRDIGEFERSRTIGLDVYADQVELLGANHPHTLMTAGGLAADLRGLGRYAEAKELDVQTYASWQDEVGDEHPRTLSALNNLAVDYRLLGDFRQALERDTQAYELRRATLGEKNLYTLSSAGSAARDVRDAGDYALSVARLQQTLDDVLATRGRSKAALTTQSSYAVALRSAGNIAEALELHESAYRDLERLLGADNPEAVSARLSLALSHLAAGHRDEAATELTELTAHFERRFGPSHPHTLVCMTDLAIAERARLRYSAALVLAARAAEGLSVALNDEHPYTLSARMNLAICMTDENRRLDMADETRLREARDLLERTLGPMQRVLQADHPNALRCEGNLALVDRELGDPTADARIANVRERVVVRVGSEQHPIVLALQQYHYLYRIIEPHPF